MKFSDHLIAEIKKVKDQQKLLNLLDRTVMIKNLIVIYHVIKGSENLLQVAVDNTPVGTALNTYFIEHLAEERSHEKWLAEDLLAAGIDVTNTMIPRQVVEMVGSIYYLIFHVDPAALLGYMAMLECFPNSKADADLLEKAHGQTLIRTLRHHVEHDPDHGSDLLKVIDDLPVSSHAIVLQSAVQSARYLGDAVASFL